jgi:hypothetical protein
MRGEGLMLGLKCVGAQHGDLVAGAARARSCSPCRRRQCRAPAAAADHHRREIRERLERSIRAAQAMKRAQEGSGEVTTG